MLDWAFTGAVSDCKGLFEEANGGTIFLDEIGEAPLAAQARLLRVLQERKIRPVGAHEERELDVRVIAATNCGLERAVAEVPEQIETVVTDDWAYFSDMRIAAFDQSVWGCLPAVQSLRRQRRSAPACAGH
jgi:sigma54-dependent transcription regulator